MNLHFNEAKSIRPKHLERCLCWDKFEKGYRCYVYDDISKYWCTQATTEHDPDGENHIVDYADYQVTQWASLIESKEPAGLDEAAENYAKYAASSPYTKDDFKAGAKWMAEQGITMEITDDTEWADVDSFVHKNVIGGVTIQIIRSRNMEYELIKH